jgi:hypothetical protein
MPYIQIATTRPLSQKEKQELRGCALAAMETLGKKRASVMVHILDGQTLLRGDTPGNCAFCDVRVLNAASREACGLFSQQLSADIARIAQTAPGSVYLSLSELTLCYTDGQLPPSGGSQPSGA